MRMVEMPRTPEELRRLLQDAAKGEGVVLTQGGEPLVTMSPRKPQRVTLGLLEGKVWEPAWFDEPLPKKVLARFERSSPDARLAAMTQGEAMRTSYRKKIARWVAASNAVIAGHGSPADEHDLP